MVCLDANFRLKRYGRVNEIIDPPLGDGFSYNVKAGPYFKHLAEFVDEQEVRLWSLSPASHLT